jgi:hypothetical protein
MSKDSLQIDYLIVGSGPSSWGAVLACLDAGIVPTVIDADNILNSSTQNIKAKYVNLIKDNTNLNFTKGLNFQKKFFLSDLPYPTIQNKLDEIPLDDPLYSRSSGGFSLVWGNALLPFRKRDMVSRAWPSIDVLHPSDYLRVLNEMGGVTLNLDFIDFTLTEQNPSLNSFSDSILTINRWGGVKKIGVSSLSLNTSTCTNCRLCMDGCLYDSLFDTRRKFSKLITLNKIRYIPNLTLESFEKNTNNINVICRNSSNELQKMEVTNLIIGAGALSSSIIVLKSTKTERLEISDSQTITFPVIRFGKLRSSIYGDIELSDVFAQSFKKCGSISNHTQIYPPNRVTQDFFRKFFVGSRLSKFISVGHTFLDPNKSGVIILQRSSNNCAPKVQFFTIRKLWHKIIGIFSVMSLTPLLIKKGVLIIPIFRFSKVGHSYHFGSARYKSPNGEETINELVSKTFDSVIIVDGSSIPSMPPGPPTLSLIAYAYKVTMRMLVKDTKKN